MAITGQLFTKGLMVVLLVLFLNDSDHHSKIWLAFIFLFLLENFLNIESHVGLHNSSTQPHHDVTI